MILDEQLFKNPELRDAFLANEQQVRISTGKLACALVFVLMPCGVSLDFVYYRAFWPQFLELRLLCSALVGIVWLLHSTAIARKHYPVVGLPIVILPAFFICWMIYATEGADSAYYAGLNLIMLAVSAVGHWSMGETFVAVGSVIIIYLSACYSKGLGDYHELFNNVYFLILTGIIVICGNHLFNRLRLREFVLRYELDRNKRALEVSNGNFEAANVKLAEQNSALEKANREIKEAEAQLVQSEKMSSLGRFSAGLMHDILNPLNYSRTGLFVLRKKTRKLPPELLADTDAVLNDVEDGLKRVEDIVSDLRTFTHPGAQAAEEVSLADVFNIAQRFISSEMKDKNISLKLDLAPGQTVWAGRNHFILVVVNLLENAIDALGEKKAADGRQAAIEVSSRTEGERSRLRIRDNGPGIAPQNLAKIFDPFFTTKEVGKGTGLGLSICFGIVRGYGGTIAVTSEPGRFCEFILDLPANEAAAAKTKPEHAEPLRI